MPDDTGELVPADLSAYTKGRLGAEDSGTGDALAAALSAARRFCRWHVTGERTETLTLDGPGSPLLALPTQHIVSIDSILEKGLLIPAGTYEYSKAGKVRKSSGAKWSRRYSAIVITLTHGWDEAPEFHRAVLSAADRLSLSTSGGRRIAVGPFKYAEDTPGSASMFTAEEQSSLALYRLEGRP